MNMTLDVTITPPDPPNGGILFVDHSKTGRSGHLGHALVEYAPGKLLAFYPNCSDHPGLNTHGPEWAGHNGDGWMEYKRSEDGGRTWGDACPLEYSRCVYAAGEGRSVMSEKAVCLGDGTIVLFNLVCDIAENRDWGPVWEPTCISSTDAGLTWSEPRRVADARGRVFDVILHDGVILALMRGQEAYVLLASTDNGRSFQQRGRLPVDDVRAHHYGTLAILSDGSLIAYVYTPQDETHITGFISRDGGHAWDAARQMYVAKKIRNPQVAPFRGGYVLHGRSGSGGLEAGHLVLYTSRNGVDWDAGRYLCMQEAGAAAYSNNLLVTGPDTAAPPRLLIQASHAYRQSRTNILHWWLS